MCQLSMQCSCLMELLREHPQQVYKKSAKTPYFCVNHILQTYTPKMSLFTQLPFELQKRIMSFIDLVTIYDWLLKRVPLSNFCCLMKNELVIKPKRKAAKGMHPLKKRRVCDVAVDNGRFSKEYSQFCTGSVKIYTKSDLSKNTSITVREQLRAYSIYLVNFAEIKRYIANLNEVLFETFGKDFRLIVFLNKSSYQNCYDLYASKKLSDYRVLFVMEDIDEFWEDFSTDITIGCNDYPGLKITTLPNHQFYFTSTYDSDYRARDDEFYELPYPDSHCPASPRCSYREISSVMVSALHFGQILNLIDYTCGFFFDNYRNTLVELSIKTKAASQDLPAITKTLTPRVLKLTQKYINPYLLKKLSIFIDSEIFDTTLTLENMTLHELEVLSVKVLNYQKDKCQLRIQNLIAVNLTKLEVEVDAFESINQIFNGRSYFGKVALDHVIVNAIRIDNPKSTGIKDAGIKRAMKKAVNLSVSPSARSHRSLSHLI